MSSRRKPFGSQRWATSGDVIGHTSPESPATSAISRRQQNAHRWQDNGDVFTWSSHSDRGGALSTPRSGGAFSRTPRPASARASLRDRRTAHPTDSAAGTPSSLLNKDFRAYQIGERRMLRSSCLQSAASEGLASDGLLTERGAADGARGRNLNARSMQGVESSPGAGKLGGKGKPSCQATAAAAAACSSSPYGTAPSPTQARQAAATAAGSASGSQILRCVLPKSLQPSASATTQRSPQVERAAGSPSIRRPISIS